MDSAIGLNSYRVALGMFFKNLYCGLTFRINMLKDILCCLVLGVALAYGAVLYVS